MAQGLERNYLIIWWWKTYGAQIHTTQACDRPHRSPRCSTSGCVMSQTPARCGCLHESKSLSESRVCSDGSGVHEPPVYIRVPGQHEHRLLDLPHPSTSRGPMCSVESTSRCRGQTLGWIRHIHDSGSSGSGVSAAHTRDQWQEMPLQTA